MPVFELNKLVRVGLPAIYEQDNQYPEVIVLKGRRLRQALFEKYAEELRELEDGECSPEGFADIYQVIEDARKLGGPGDWHMQWDEADRAIRALVERSGIDPADVAVAKAHKFEQKGGFTECTDRARLIGKFITRLTVQEDDPWVGYYRREPARFPERGHA